LSEEGARHSQSIHSFSTASSMRDSVKNHLTFKISLPHSAFFSCLIFQRRKIRVGAGLRVCDNPKIFVGRGFSHDISSYNFSAASGAEVRIVQLSHRFFGPALARFETSSYSFYCDAVSESRRSTTSEVDSLRMTPSVLPSGDQLNVRNVPDLKLVICRPGEPSSG